MINKLLLVLSVWCFFSEAIMAQGGNTAASASGSPVSLPFSSNGSTIGATNDYNFPTGYTNWTTSGPDWLYYFCATSTSQVSILLTNMVTIPVASSINASITVWNGVPGAGGVLVAGKDEYLSPATSTTTATQDVLQFNAVSSTCYYIMIDNYYQSSDTSTRNGFNYSLTIQIPPADILQPSCTNTDFEAGTLSGWYGTYGHTVEKGGVGASTPSYTPAFYGINSTDFAITSGSAVDPYGGFPMVCPGFGNNSVRLGDLNNVAPGYTYPDRGGASLEQKFSVTASNALFVYEYACVIQDGGADHPNEEQPFFKAEVIDCNGNPINCGQYLVTGGPGVPGFTLVSGTTDIYYKNWAPVFMDLTAYIGTCVTVRFTTADCSRGGHFCYAYIDAMCGPMIITGPTYVCPSGSATLTSPLGGISYEWTVQGASTVIGTAQTISISPTVPTTYQCEITSATGCNAILTFDALIFPITSVTCTSDTTCPGIPGVLTAMGNPSGGTYSWSPGFLATATISQSPVLTTMYTCSYTDLNGCTAIGTGVITVNPTESPSTVPVSYCLNDVAIPLTAAVTSGFSLNWYGTNSTGGPASSTAPTPLTTVAGITTYYVSQTNNSSGCESPRVPLIVTINPLPVLPLTAPVSYCLNSPAVQLIATALAVHTLNWYGTNATGGIASVTAPVPLTSTVGTTTYYVSQTNTTTGCESPRAALLVTINPLPNVIVNSPTICPTSTAVLTATGAVLYEWNGDQALTANPYSVTPVATTAYTVVGTDGNGCSAPAVSMVTVFNALSVTVNSPSICVGETVLLTPSGGTTYSWDSGGVTGISTANPFAVNPTVTTTYTVKGTTNGCTGSAVATVTVNPLPAGPVTSPIVYCLNAQAVPLTAVVDNGCVLNWYGTNATGGTASLNGPVPATSTVGISTYYVSQTNVLTGCEGPRSPLNVMVNSLPAAIVTVPEVYCQNDVASALTASADPGCSLNWYGTNAVGGIPSSIAPIPLTLVVETTVYYVSQTDLSTGCEGPRVPLNISINPLPLAPQTAPVEYCENDIALPLFASETILSSDIYALNWYGTNATGGTASSIAPTPSTANVGTTNYYVSQTNLSTGCEGPRAVLMVTVVAPIIPNFSSVNPVCEGSIAPVLPVNSLDNPSIIGEWTPIVTTLSAGSSTYTFNPDSGQCAVPTTIVITVNPLPTVVLTNPADVCVPNTVDITSQAVTFGSTGTLSFWMNPEATIPLNSPSSIAVSGTYYIKSDLNGCVLVNSVEVVIHPLPIADFNPVPVEISTFDPYSIMNNTSIGAVSYSWDFGDNSQNSSLENPEHYFPEETGGTYRILLVATSEYGCVDTAYSQILINEELIFYIPNTFTPDRDTYNETFQPVFTSGFDPFDFTMFVFDRWGELIFESHNSEVGWDGTYGPEKIVCQDDTYTWKIVFKMKETTQRKTVVGHINLLR